VAVSGSVSTPRHLEPDVGNYPIRLSCSLHTKVYVSYRAGSAFGLTPRDRMVESPYSPSPR